MPFSKKKMLKGRNAREGVRRRKRTESQISMNLRIRLKEEEFFPGSRLKIGLYERRMRRYQILSLEIKVRWGAFSM